MRDPNQHSVPNSPGTNMFAGQDLRQEFRLLFLGAVLDEEGACQADAVVGNARAAEARPFLDINHVLGRVQAHAAIFDRPDR